VLVVGLVTMVWSLVFIAAPWVSALLTRMRGIRTW
jgi:hypothetical protein